MTPFAIELLIFDGCPHAEPARALLREVVATLAPSAKIDEVNVTSAEQARRVGFLGSPSIRIDGRDVAGVTAPDEPSLCCRVYGESGVPPRWMVEATILRALAPRSYLFLCVANSARSQLAEGCAMKIQVLGTGCMKCNKLYAEVQQAIAQAGVSAELSKVERLEEIVKFGAAFTPALVIDGEVKSQGKLPAVEQVVSWIKQAAGE